MADWVWSSLPWVWFRYCSATAAPLLVLTLKDMAFSVLLWWAARSAGPLGNYPQKLLQPPCQPINLISC